MRRLTIIFALIVLLTGACGYSFRSDHSALPDGVHSINVPTVKNATTYTELTNSLTNQLIHQFTLSQGLRVTVPDEADAILETEVKSVQIQGAARSSDRSSSASRRVIVEVAAVLKLKEGGTVVWQTDRVEGRRTYRVVTDQSVVEANLSLALQDIAQEIAEKIQRYIFEDF
jgi:outer membrane lipopolysaccharide assembly protein LptE/RlpB